MANNKKGQEEWVNFILVSLLFLILIGFALSFIILDVFKKTPYQQVISEKTSDLTFALLTYLKTPVEDKTISDLMVKSYYQNNYEELNEKTREILEAIKSTQDGKVFGYNIEFILMPDNKNLNSVTTYHVTGFYTVTESIAMVPLEESKFIKVRLYEECQGC